MPPRRRQSGNVPPRRSERLRLLREASAQSAMLALRASANRTPTNLPIAIASHTINAPSRRPRIRRWQGMDRSLVLQETREAAAAPPLVRPSRFLDIFTTGYGVPPAGSEDTPENPTPFRTSTPTPASEAMAAAGALPSRTPWGIPVSPMRPRPVPPTASRLKRELQSFLQEPPEDCQVEVVNDNVFHWRARIAGPPETPYEGGQFHLDLHFAHDYPFSPPKVYFLTKIYHCNIAATGYICLDILNREWSPALTVAKVLLSITSLLADPNPDDPLEPTIASMYKRQRGQHDRTARAWTAQYAKMGQDPPNPEYD